MNTWTSDELDKVGNAEELQIASLRGDGMLRKLGSSGSSASAMISTSGP